jgi:ribA/ribD-fused uncharacterized protein
MIERFVGKYEFLSNFYACEIEYDGILYPTSEHAYQAAKTLDPEIRKYVREIPTPGAAKKFAKKLVIREDWNDVKFGIMEDILKIKFSKEPFKTMLLKTGEEEIIEGNHWHDQTWGKCLCSKHGGKGENALGKILMKIRSSLT